MFIKYIPEARLSSAMVQQPSTAVALAIAFPSMLYTVIIAPLVRPVSVMLSPRVVMLTSLCGASIELSFSSHFSNLKFFTAMRAISTVVVGEVTHRLSPENVIFGCSASTKSALLPSLRYITSLCCASACAAAMKLNNSSRKESRFLFIDYFICLC